MKVLNNNLIQNHRNLTLNCYCGSVVKWSKGGVMTERQRKMWAEKAKRVKDSTSTRKGRNNAHAVKVEVAKGGTIK